jgi:N-acetyl-gamma-glutamyl-phosphate reductase
VVHTTVVGAQGYLGRAILRTLWRHPDVTDVTAVSRALRGQPVRTVVAGAPRAALFSAPDDAAALAADVVFLAVPAGAAAERVAAHEAAGAQLVIDLSRDHRHAGLASADGWQYAMPDVLPAERGAKRIANPGCYPTAAMLALAPALRGGAVGSGPIIVDGKSGVSGAGQSPRADLHFPEANESVRAYKVLGHDHTSEMAEVAGILNGHAHAVRFTPHLVPQTRGLLCTVYAPLADPNADPAAVRALYEAAYAASPFVDVVVEADTGRVRGAHTAEVAVDCDPDTGLLVARGAIDNLARGGGSAAVANMNGARGFALGAGLDFFGGNT